MQANAFLKRKSNVSNTNDVKKEVPTKEVLTLQNEITHEFQTNHKTDCAKVNKIQEQILYQHDVLKKIYSYLTSTEEPKKPIVLVGSSGCGKTLAIETVASQLKRDLAVFYGDEEETVDIFLKTFGIHNIKRVYVFDSVEAYDNFDFTKHYEMFIKKRCIFVTTDLYDCPAALRTKCQVVRMNTLHEFQVISILKDKYAKIPETALRYVAEAAKQDIRYAFNMLEYAIQTAKAKKEHHKTIITEQDLRYDLFGTTYNVLACKAPVCGIQSADLFMFSSMLQSNAYQWCKKADTGLDAFCLYDIMETTHEFSIDDLNTYLDATVQAHNNFKKEQQLQMPNYISIKKKLSLLTTAANIYEQLETSDALSLHDTLNVLRSFAPERISKGSVYYHENQDIRNYRKLSPFQ